MQLVVARPCFGGQASSISDIGEVVSQSEFSMPVAVADAA
jgi:hypothetical protein